jgi:hypothetical protein
MFEVRTDPPRNRTSNRAVAKKRQEEKPVSPLFAKSLKPPQNVCKPKLSNGQGFTKKTKKSYKKYLFFVFCCLDVALKELFPSEGETTGLQTTRR